MESTENKFLNLDDKWSKTLEMLQEIGRYDNYLYDFWEDGIHVRFRVQKEVYNIVKSNWEADMTPFVTELLYLTTGMCWKNQVRNIIGMILVDFALDGGIHKAYLLNDKIYLLNKILEERGLNNFVHEISWDWIEKAKRTACRIHGRRIPHFEDYRKFEKVNLWEDYYRLVVRPMMSSIVTDGAHGKLFAICDDWREVAVQLHLPEQIEDDVIQFFIEDAMDYINACDCNSYNPIWILGTECYEKILNEVWSWE